MHDLIISFALCIWSQFTWPAVREFHAAVLFEIECGRAHWGDSFADLESRLFRNSMRPTAGAVFSRSGTPILFCRDYQNDKCLHAKDHFGPTQNETKWLQHICAKCWTVSRVMGRHSEFSPNCPTKSSVSGSSIDQTSPHSLPDALLLSVPASRSLDSRLPAADTNLTPISRLMLDSRRFRDNHDFPSLHDARLCYHDSQIIVSSPSQDCSLSCSAQHHGSSSQQFVSLHQPVCSFDQYNFLGARLPVPSALNIPLWRSRLQDYPNFMVCEFLEFG